MKIQSSTTVHGMPDLLELLESFNRKERFFLIRHALGDFQLGSEFSRQLGDEIGLTIPRGAFSVTDYHIDSLAAVVWAHRRGDVKGIFKNPQQRLVRGNQEDIDLLVGFKDDGQYHLVLVEAKGVGSWDNRQLLSKADRLRQIFGCDGDRHPGVVPHFCLMSPRPPQQLKASKWPGWMSKNDGSYFWTKLEFPEERRVSTRCDGSGRQSANGCHFRIICD